MELTNKCCSKREEGRMAGRNAKDGTALPGSAEFVTMGKQQAETLAEIQAELFSKLQQANLRWIDTTQKRAKLASEFSTKLAAARSVPETASACQDWIRQRMEIAEEDAKHLVADSQALMEAGVRFISNGWLSNERTKT
jgi:hypothetical protein